MARAQMRGQDVPSTWSCTPAITCWQLIVISQVKKDMLLQQVACFPMLSKYLKLLISELQRKQILHLLRITRVLVFLYVLVFSSLSWKGVTFISKSICCCSTWPTIFLQAVLRENTHYMGQWLYEFNDTVMRKHVAVIRRRLTIDKDEQTLRTKWNTVLPDMLTKAQVVRKFPAVHGTKRLTNVFIRACHWSISWARLIQLTHSHLISLRWILILVSHLHTGFPCGPFPWSFHTKTFSTMCATRLILVKMKVV